MPDKKEEDLSEDQLDWDNRKHGSFETYAEPDDAVGTAPADEYLESMGD